MSKQVKTKKKTLNKILIFALLFCAMMLLTACNEERVNSSYYVIEDVVQTPEPKEEEKELLTAEKTIFKLFYPDETGQVMLTSQIEVEEISKITIIEKILELGYINENTRLIKLTGEELEDGRRLLTAEFSEELRETFVDKEEEEGQIIFACIVNTILDAYDATGIMVLVGSEEMIMPSAESILEMNPVDLPEGYYSAFDLTPAQISTKDVEIQGEIQTIVYEQFYSEEGYSIFYENENYTRGYNATEGLAVFESLDYSTSMSIYVSESSKTDAVQILSEQLELGVEEVAEILEMEIGVGGYKTTGIFKSGEERIYNYYVVEHNNQVYIIEIRMNQETSLEQGEHIAYMLETFQIW